MSGASTDLGRVAFLRLLAVVTAFGFLLRVSGLDSDPPLADDVAAGISAVNFVERGQVGPTMWQHPRLRDLFVYASSSALGSNKLGYCFPSLVLGTAAIPVVGLLGLALGGPLAGLVAAVLVAADALHVGYSRQAVQEVYTTLFGALGILLALSFDRSRRAYFLALSGLSFGLGTASKWSVAFAAVATLVWLLRRELRRSPDRVSRTVGATFVVTALAVVPAAVYLLSWAPWLLAGRDLADLAHLHRAMIAEATTHGGFNPADLALPHHAWQWFVTPVAFADFVPGAGGPIAYVFLTNPLVWLLVLPAAVVMTRHALRTRDACGALVAGAFVVTYVPFLLAGRPIWAHSALAVLPLAAVMVAAMLARAAARTRRPRLTTLAYVAAVLAIAAPLYVLARGRAMDRPLLRSILEHYRPAATLEVGAGRP